MSEETIAIAYAAIRMYAETHPRPSQVTQKQAAEMMSLSQPTVMKLIREGIIRRNKAGQIPTSEVDRALAAA